MRQHRNGASDRWSFYQRYTGQKTKRDPMDGVTLDTLEPGQKGRILRIKGAGEISKRIADMGLVRGTMIEVERVAPLGDPVEFKIKGYHLSLRKREAQNIWVEPL